MNPPHFLHPSPVVPTRFSLQHTQQNLLYLREVPPRPPHPMLGSQSGVPLCVKHPLGPELNSDILASLERPRGQIVYIKRKRLLRRFNRRQLFQPRDSELQLTYFPSNAFRLYLDKKVRQCIIVKSRNKLTFWRVAAPPHPRWRGL